MNDESRLQVERYLALANRRKWVLIIPVALALLGAGLLSVLTEPVYESKATVRLNVTSLGIDSADQNADVRVINTYAALVKTAPMLSRVIDDLDLNTTVPGLRGRVTTARPTEEESELVEIKVKAPTASESAAVANRLAALLKDPVAIAACCTDLATAELAAASITVFEQAEEPSGPTSPRWKFNLAAGLLGGLVAGVALALVLEYVDPTLRGVRDLESVTVAPVLASIPFGVRWKYPPPPVSPDYRLLATKLQTTLQDQGQHSVLFTSPRPDQGNTTVATYTAMAMAQAGLRVIIVDANLIRPDLHKLFNLHLAPGLFNFISTNGSRPNKPQEEALEEIVQKTPVPRLSVLTAGSKLNDPSELLAAMETREFLRFLETQWDVVIIDGPPMQTSAGSAVIAPVVDGVVVVAAEGQSSARIVEETVGELTSLGAHPLGIVYCKASEG